MYTHQIKSQVNGVATVEFSNGETETYTEQIIVSEAQFATENTPFIPPVFEIVEHTRPKVLTFTFKDDENLEINIQDKLNTLNGVVDVIPTPSPEVLARNAWLENWHKYLKAKKAMEALRDADITPSVEEETAFTALKQWVVDNRRIEYVEFM